VSDANGENAAQVTQVKSMFLSRPNWSPDGQTLLFVSRANPLAVYTVSAAARMARPKRLTTGPPDEVGEVSWSHDGKSVYAEWRGGIWKFTPGKDPLALTSHMGGSGPMESPDGKFVYYRFRRTIWRVPAGGGAEEEVMSPDMFIAAIEPVPKGVYYMGWESRRRVAIGFYDFAAKKSSDVLALNDAEISRNATFDVSPDGRYLLYPKIDRAETDVVLVENFR
jgi:hypothetical protein